MSKLKHINRNIDWHFETARIIARLKATGAMMAYIDLFCGAGGTSSGVEKAKHEGKMMACVILGINHDLCAIQSHRINHPDTLHMVEDVRKVNLAPIAEMVAAIRKALSYIKIVVWSSAECTHISKAKGGDHREADSRSLAEELYRYEKALKPDLIQIENVTEFRSWGPLMHKKHITPVKVKEYKFKMFDVISRKNLVSNNKKVWLDRLGYYYKFSKKKGLQAWMIPIPEMRGIYFRKWVKHLSKRGYEYADRNLNSANFGAFTKRERYFGQFTSISSGIPITYPESTHSKGGKNGLQPHKAVKEVLELEDTGESLFTPGRITSPKSFDRVFEGCIRFVPKGGKKEYEDFLVVYNSTTKDGNLKHAVRSMDDSAPVVSTRNSIYKVNVEAVYPFLIQYNNNCDSRSVDDSMPVLTQKEKFGLLNPESAFIAQRNSGPSSSKVVSINQPARVITQTGGNQQLVQPEEILPFLCTYHGSGAGVHKIEKPSPVVDCKDRISVNTPEPFIMRDFTNGGQHAAITNPAGALMTYPKMNIVSPQSWIMDTNFNNVGQRIEESANTVLSSKRYPYYVNTESWLMDHQFNNTGTSTNETGPTIIAKQDKKPLHLVQVEYAEGKFYYGIAIYKTDCEEIRKLKKFMAMYGIKDIKMRMLKETELLQIQGFDKEYFERVRKKGIKVTSTNAKKYIGNSVEVNTAKALVECYGPVIIKMHPELIELRQAA